MDQPNGAQNNNQPANEPNYNEQDITAPPAAASPVASQPPVNSGVMEQSPVNSEFSNPTYSTAGFAPISQQAPVIAGATQPAKKSGKKWLPLAIAGGALLLMGGGASAYYLSVYQNPEKVIYDAYVNLVSAKTMQLSGNVDFEMDSINGLKLKSISYESKSDSAPGAQLDLKANLVVMSSDITVGGKGMFTDNGDLYFQLNGVKDSFKTLMKTMGSTQDVPAEYYAALEKLENQWVKVVNEDIKKGSEELAKVYQCTIDASKKNKDSDNKDLIAAYEKYQFVQKKEDLGYKDGNVGYKLNFDEAKFKDFSKAVEETQYAKDLKDCTKDLEETDMTAFDDDGMDNPKVDSNSSVSVWIDQWSHKLKKVEYSAAGEISDYKLGAKGEVNVGYDEKAKVVAPSDSISLDEFVERGNDLQLPVPGAASQEYDSDLYSSSL